MSKDKHSLLEQFSSLLWHVTFYLFIHKTDHVLPKIPTHSPPGLPLMYSSSAIHAAVHLITALRLCPLKASGGLGHLTWVDAGSVFLWLLCGAHSTRRPQTPREGYLSFFHLLKDRQTQTISHPGGWETALLWTPKRKTNCCCISFSVVVLYNLIV